MFPRRSDSSSIRTTRGKSSISGFLAATFLGLGCLGAHGALIGHYEFHNDFSNSLTAPGVLPSLTPVAAPDTSNFYEEGGWYWNNISAASGLNLATAPLENYSIAIAFEFSHVNGYRKIIDFSNLGADTGLYIYDGRLIFFGPNASGPVSAVPDTLITLIVTRAGNGATNLYLNGATTPIITFTDAGNTIALNGPLNFFLDDRSGSEYSPAGSVFQIMIWDNVLSSEEVADVFQAIPEPMTLNLVGGAALAAFAFRRRLTRQQRAS